jgi:hypothetical protein
MVLQKKYSLFKIEQNHDIICVVFNKNLKVDIEIANQLVSDRLDFTQNKNYYYIIDLSNVRQITPDAKFFMQRSDGALKNILGAAFIASNPVSALLANIFIKAEKDFPSKFFSKMNDALDWIHELKSKRRPLTYE